MNVNKQNVCLCKLLRVQAGACQCVWVSAQRDNLCSYACVRVILTDLYNLYHGGLSRKICLYRPPSLFTTPPPQSALHVSSSSKFFTFTCLTDHLR